MKVLYLAFGRDLGSPDAGTTHTMNMAHALAALGHDVTVAARRVGGRDDCVTFVEHPHQRRFGRGSLSAVPEQLMASARRADVIQERAEESGGLGLRIARSLGKPFVLEVNAPLSGYPNSLLRKVADWNLRRQAKAASAVITQTSISRTIIERYATAPLFVVPNGADPQTFSPEVEPAQVPGATPERAVIAFSGSLRGWHGVEDLLAAGSRVLEKRADAFFLIVGGGPREAKLRKLAKRTLGAENHHFTGAVDPAEVPRYLAAAQILAAPFSLSRHPVRSSQFEVHGMWWSPVKIFEYMAMGRPVVASSAGMVPEYLARAGVTYPPGDTDALAREVTGLLKDDARRDTLGRAARERFLANYTWEEAARRTAAAWEDVRKIRQKVSLTT